MDISEITAFLQIIPYVSLALILLGFPIFFIAFCLIWTRSHPTVGRGFKTLYSLMVISAMIMHTLSFGFVPLIIPPYRAAIMTVGLFSFGSKYSNLETALCYTSLYALITSNASLLYYRMNLLLPSHHILNTKFIRRLVYTFMFGSVPPTILVWYIMGNNNQLKGRIHFYREFGDIPIWPLVNSSAVIYEVSIENEYCWLLIIYIVIFLVLPCVAIVGLFFYCLLLLKKISQTISQKTVQLHSSFLLTIISQVAVEAVVFALPFATIIILIFCGTQRIDIIFVLESTFGLSSVSCIVSMIVANKTYRTALIGFFKRGNEPEYFRRGTAIFELSQRAKTPNNESSK